MASLWLSHLLSHRMTVAADPNTTPVPTATHTPIHGSGLPAGGADGSASGGATDSEDIAHGYGSDAKPPARQVADAVRTPALGGLHRIQRGYVRDDLVRPSLAARATPAVSEPTGPVPVSVSGDGAIGAGGSVIGSSTKVTRPPADGSTRLGLPARYGRAIPLYERTPADRVRVLGEGHPDTLISRNNLAAAYEAVGDYGRAIPLLEWTLAD